MKTTPRPDLEFARLSGQMAESLSFNRSIGQIYGLLYIRAEPLSLDEIARQLLMSKGNASINLRTLESWEAIRSVSVSGSRRDHYQANPNLKEIVLRRLQEGFSRRLALAEERLDALSAGWNGGAKDSPAFKRFQEMHSMVLKARRAVGLLPKVLGFLSR